MECSTGSLKGKVGVLPGVQTKLYSSFSDTEFAMLLGVSILSLKEPCVFIQDHRRVC